MTLLRFSWATAPIALACAVACTDADTPADGGTNPDAVVVARPDAAGLDAAAADAVVAPDAPAPDAEPLDGGDPDGGDPTAMDSGASDSGDAGAVADAQPVIHAFSPGGHDRLFGAAFDAQNNLIAVGVTSSGTIAADLETIVVRIRPDGTLDPAFGTAGVFRRNLAVGGTAEVARGVVIQSDGRIVVSAAVEAGGGADPRDTNVALLRLTRTGTVDASFGTDGVAIHDLGAGAAAGNGWAGDAPWGLALAPDDALVLEASRKSATRADTDYVIAKLTSRGALDRGFATGGIFELDLDNQNASARNPTVLPDGSIFSTGYMTVAGVTTPVIYKLTPAGALDERFAARGVFNTGVLSAVTEVYAIAAQSTGALVTAGYGREPAMGTNDFLSLRLSATGEVDRTWGTNGAAIVDIGGMSLADNCRDLVVLPDDRVVLVGNGRSAGTNGEGAVVVLTSTGAPDRSFGPRGVRTYDLGGPADAFWDVARAPDGRLGIVGLRGASGNGNDDAVVLILPPL